MGFLSNLFGGKTSEVEQPTTEAVARPKPPLRPPPLRRFSAQYPAP